MKRYIITPLFCVIFFSLTGCKNEEKTVAEPTVQYCLNENFKSKIEVSEVKTENVAERVHLTGHVETNPDKVVEFTSLVNGIIVNTHFSLGDRVTKGQVLAELKSTELTSLQAQLSTINSQIQVSERNLKATEELFSDGISSQKEILEIQNDLESFKAEKLRISSDIELYSGSTQKGVFLIKAPASGIITSKSISNGKQITSDGESLFTISDVNEVWIMANIYATNINEIKTGMKVEITSLSYPDKVFSGIISMIPPVLDEESKVLKARVVITNDDGLLKPGMLVDLMALKDSEEKAVTIPIESIVFSNNENYVLVYTSDCDIEVRKIEIIATNEKNIYVGSGLKEGEKIISKNQLLVFEQIKNF